jgi:hypothetical protein
MIEITRICDTCHCRRGQNIDPKIKTAIYQVAFTCDTCIREKGQKPDSPHVKDLVDRHREEEEVLRQELGRSPQRSSSDFI